MNELNAMARDLGVENFGTMRKHEVIFHVLQKNAERAGGCFPKRARGVAGSFGFLRSQSFNYLPCPEDIYVSPSQIRRFDLQTGNLVAGQIVRRRRRKSFSPLLKVEGVDGEDPTRPRENAFRQSHAAVPQQAVSAGNRRGRVIHARAGFGLPDWQRLARIDCRAARAQAKRFLMQKLAKCDFERTTRRLTFSSCSLMNGPRK